MRFLEDAAEENVAEELFTSDRNILPQLDKGSDRGSYNVTTSNYRI